MSEPEALAPRHAAIVLAGGNATRMGGVPKPELKVGERTLLRRVVDAVPHARPHIVVGDVPSRDYIVTVEDPPGSGPGYAVRAGLELVPTEVGWVLVLAGDLPFLTGDLTASLLRAAADRDGAVLVDHHGRPQWLCGAWRHEVLISRFRSAQPGWGMRASLGDADVAEVDWSDADLPPWFDCDTPAALEYARQLEAAFGVRT